MQLDAGFISIFVALSGLVVVSIAAALFVVWLVQFNRRLKPMSGQLSPRDSIALTVDLALRHRRRFGSEPLIITTPAGWRVIITPEGTWGTVTSLAPREGHK